MYGEWLREQFDKGAIPEPTYDPDLAILLSQLRENSTNQRDGSFGLFSMR